jgi:hypothetical protein
VNKFQEVVRYLAAGLLLVLSATLYSGSVGADTWRFEPICTVKTQEFGDVSVESTVITSKDARSRESVFRVYQAGHLKSEMPGVEYEHLFASPDGKVFLTLSNSGLIQPAVMLFSASGEVILMAHHNLAQFDYCNRSVTIRREWYDGNMPGVRFDDGDELITLRDCRGHRISLLDAVFKAYGAAFTLNEAYKKSKTKQ